MNWLYVVFIGYVLGTVGVYRAPVALRIATEAVKGAIVFCLCALLFGFSGWPLAFSFGAYAIGRRLPVYRHLKGSPAVEAGVSFLLCLIIQAGLSGVVPWTSVSIAVAVALLLSVTRTWEVPLLCASFFVGVVLSVAERWAAFSPATAVTAAYLVFESVCSIVSTSMFRLGEKGEVKLWRILARPFALLFLLIDILQSRRALLFVIGIVALVFIVTDFVRLATKKSLNSVFKKKEANRFSSMTLFLVSSFLSFLLFPAKIPYVTLICITFGDLFSKMIGMHFGKIKLYKSRTVEGSLAFLAGSLIFNGIAAMVFEISLIYVVVGSVIAAITELFSEAIDDNFSVSIVTGGVLAALRYFLSV